MLGLLLEMHRSKAKGKKSCSYCIVRTKEDLNYREEGDVGLNHAGKYFREAL